MDWSIVPSSAPIHVSGCGDTFAGSFVASISSDRQIPAAIKCALTAAQISLRSAENIAQTLF